MLWRTRAAVLAWHLGMDDIVAPGWLGRRAVRAIGGIARGVLGALAILLLMTLISVAERNPWWSYSNVLATVFYGPRALRAGLGWMSVSGAAFQVLLCGVSGAMFGILFGLWHSGPRLLLAGLFWGMVWYFGTQALFNSVARLIPLYAPEPALLGAHTVFGLILGLGSRPAGGRAAALPEAVAESSPPIG